MFKRQSQKVQQASWSGWQASLLLPADQSAKRNSWPSPEMGKKIAQRIGRTVRMLFCSAEYTEKMSKPDNYKDRCRTLRTSPRWYIARRQREQIQKVYSRLDRRTNSQQDHGQRKEDLPFNEVQTRGSCDYMANLARLQSKCSIFKLLLHVALGKETAGVMVSWWNTS